MLSNGKKNYAEDSSIGFCNIYPLDSGLSGEQRYPTFEQPEPEVVNNKGEALQVEQSTVVVCAINTPK